VFAEFWQRPPRDAESLHETAAVVFIHSETDGGHISPVTPGQERLVAQSETMHIGFTG
jgi:hypothetical protein